MKVYIAGPMRGVKYFNFPAFDAARDKLKALGFDPVSPADMDREIGFDAMKLEVLRWDEWNDSFLTFHGFDREAAMKRDLEAVLDCSAIYLLDGWEKSPGALAELEQALMSGKKVFTERGATAPGPEPVTHETILDEAKALVTGDRNAAYGPPNQDFQRTASMWTGLLQFKLKDGEVIRAQDVAWMMMMLKASRAQHSDKRDNYVDAAGYAYCGWRCGESES